MTDPREYEAIIHRPSDKFTVRLTFFTTDEAFRTCAHYQDLGWEIRQWPTRIRKEQEVAA